MKVVWIVAVAIVVQAAAIASGAAQDYPVRDIRVLSGQAAGSGADAIVQFFAEMLRRKLNRNVIVENKPGILGSFAGEALARAPADGHTIFISGYPAVSSNQLLFSQAILQSGDGFCSRHDAYLSTVCACRKSEVASHDRSRADGAVEGQG